MHLRIYLWLSCVVLAGYVRATEVDVASETSTTEAVPVLNDDHIPADTPLFDDEGSGVEPDESSGSGWGAGPGVDDEDGQSSGDSAVDPELPEDDEDYAPRLKTTTVPTVQIKNETDDYYAPEYTDNQDPDPDIFETPRKFIPDLSPEQVTPETEPTVPSTDPSFDVVIPNVKNKNVGPVEPRSKAEVPPRETDISITGEDTNQPTDHDPAGSNVDSESRPPDNVVFIMNTKNDERATSFFAQPGILAAVIGGAVVGLLCAILVVMFIVYRMRKKDEGSYALDEPKRSPAAASYGKGHNNREFYA